MTLPSGEAPGPLVLSMLNALGRSGLAALQSGEAQLAARAGDTVSLEPASPDDLAHAGLTALRDALTAGNERSAAFDLLTADALITKACEAAATGALPASLSAARFATLLEEAR